MTRTRGFKRIVVIAALALAASACGNGDSGGGGNGGGNGGNQFSDAFRNSFLSACESTSGGQTDYCECALDHLEANVEDESSITTDDQAAAAEACAGELSNT